MFGSGQAASGLIMLLQLFLVGAVGTGQQYYPPQVSIPPRPPRSNSPLVSSADRGSPAYHCSLVADPTPRKRGLGRLSFVPLASTASLAAGESWARSTPPSVADTGL